MESFNVDVIWKGKTFSIDLDTTAKSTILKEALFKVTGVPPAKQKVISKSKGLWKGVLKDGEDLSKFKWSENTRLTLLGNAEGAPKKPKNETVFVEDMDVKEQQQLGKQLPPGLDNLGNTCFLNSTLQCLRAIPELRRSLETMDNVDGTPGKRMTAALGKLFSEMDSTVDKVTPVSYVQLMRETFPQFAERDQITYRQQDADEFYNTLVSEMARHLTTTVPDVDFGSRDNAVHALFGIQVVETWKCLENDEEPIVVKSDELLRLQCKISDKTRTLEDGLKLGFEGEAMKMSDILGRDAKWKTQLKISKLPLYLVIQFNRFFWKLTPESRDHQGVNCKIRKEVKFPLELDIHEFCDEELCAIMKPARARHTQNLLAMNGETTGIAEVSEEQNVSGMSPERTAGPGISINFRGIYEMFAVVTHKGRSSDSGHYMSWVKQGPDRWVCFDDEDAAECRDEDIMNLSGKTADWHIAYMAYYRVKMD